MSRLRRLPLRVRLTLAFACASALLLAAAGTGIFLEVKHGLDASLDASLRQRAEQYGRLAGRSDPSLLRRALALEAEPVQLLAADGTRVAASPAGDAPPLLSGARLRAALTGELRLERQERIRLLARPVGAGRVIVVTTSMVQRERALETLGGVLLIGGPLILLLSSGAGYLVASGALRPVDRMRRRADEIRAETLDARLPLPRTHDELRRLGETLNAMLARLEAAADQERAFLATASHELRTPLAILKAEVDLALDGAAGEAELRAALESIAEEASRLIRLAEELLVIARGREGALPLHLRPVALADLAQRVASRFAHASAADVTSTVPAGLTVPADELRLEQALDNLVENALRHGAAPVEIRAERHGETIELHVVDAGAGFGSAPAAGGGFGLGLPIVEAIARAHGGSVAVADAPGGGADVAVALPFLRETTHAPAREPGWSGV